MQTGTQQYQNLRAAVLQRDGLVCQYCGTTTAAHYVMEHVVPERRGGVSDLYNLVCACLGCNTSKGNAVWIPANIEAVMADQPTWKAWVREHAESRTKEPSLTFSAAGVPVALHRRIKILALRQELTMRDLVIEALTDILQKYEREDT